MRINKLKAVSLIIFTLVIALWSETQGMEKRLDLLESAIVKSGTTTQLSDQYVSNELTSDPNSAPLVNFESPISSWYSYWLSPAKVAMKSAYDIMNFTTQNPQKALIIGFFLSYQFTTTAATSCLCKLENGNVSSFSQFCMNGGVPNATACDEYCAAFNKFLFHGCS
jgi:hypothetical protein